MQQVKGQLRLTQKLTKAAAVAERKHALGHKETQSDLPLSTEMMDWLTHSFDVQADDATLPETISSRFIQPMDAMAVYCPTAAISASQFSATRVSNLSIGSTVPFLPNGTFYSHRSNWKETFANTKIIESNNPTMEVFAATGRSSNNFAENMTMSSVTGTSDPINRLNVLWLKRKAQLECEAGDNNAALKTLDEAIAAHLGTDDYLKADLRGDVATSDAAALLDAIDDNYVRYDPSVHVKAVLIQRVYRQRIEKKRAAATVLSRFYRGYLARRALWTKHDLLRQSASMIQKLVRNHLWRRHKLASRLQKWYAVWKQVHLYIKMRERHRAAIVIQRIWRGFLCRSRVTVTAILHKIMARKIQRLFRSFLLRSRRVVGLALYHKLFYLSSRVIQCAARKFQARARRRQRCHAAECREDERRLREREYITSLVADDVQRTKFYVNTPSGRLHVVHTANSIAAKDAFLREKHRGKYTAADELRRKEGLVAFQILNRSGDGHLTAHELMEALSELSIVLVPDQLNDLAAHMGLASPLTPEIDGETGFPGHINCDTFMRWYDIRKSSKFASPTQSRSGSPMQSPTTSVRISSSSGARPSSPLQSAFGLVSDVAVMTGNAIRQVLRERLYELEVTGMLLNIRAEREIARLSAELQKLKAMAVFRRNAPPRFQCCQCRATFAVFGAYYEHFPSLGRCATLSLPGMFYRKCSLSWMKQRECEEEAIRRHEEKLFLDYSLTRAWFAELSLMDNISIRSLIAKDVSAYNRIAAQEQIKNEEVTVEGGGVAPKSTRSVRKKALAKRTLSGLPDLLVPVTGDPLLVQLSSALISSKLNFPMPTNWLEHDNDLVAEDIRDWMTIMMLPVPTGKAAISPVEDEGADADGGASTRKPIFTWLQEKPRERKVSPYQAAELRIKLLRLLLFALTEVLAASGEFEHQRPRCISVSDKELVAKGHKDLTHAAHVAFITEILQGIDALRAKWRELLHATALRSGKASSLQSDSQIGSLYGTVDVMEGLVQNMELEDAYLRAHVRTSQWIHSSLGRRHISRLSGELWVAKQRFKADGVGITDNQQTGGKKATKAVKATSDNAVTASPKSTKARYLFHRLVRSTWVPNNSTVSHLYGSAEAASIAVAMMGSEALDVLGSTDLRGPDPSNAKGNGTTSTAPHMTPSLSLFELQWLARAMGMHIPASRLQEVERQLDPQRSGQFTSEDLLQWISKEETGGLSSIVQSIANAMAAGTRMLTGTYYSEHARQIVLLAARKRARLVLQYEHECLTDLKAGGASLKAKNSKSSKKQAKSSDSDIFHQGGGLTTQLVALRCAHETCELALVRKAKDEQMARRRLRPRWWRRDDAAVAVAESTMLVHAVVDMVNIFGGLTRAIVLNMDQAFGEVHTKKPLAGPLALPTAQPNEDVDVPAAETVPLLAASDEVGSPSPVGSEQNRGQQDDAGDHFHILEVPTSSSAEANALLVKTRDTVASLLVHLFDVTCAQDLSEDQVKSLLLFLQHGVSERELLRRFPGISYQKMGLSHMARFLQQKLPVLPEASVRDTSLLGKLFGTNRAFLTRCSDGTAARALASLGATEPVKLKARAIDRYWQAFGEYSSARIASFFATKPEDDKIATQLSLKEQERQESNDLLLLHRVQLLAMRQVKLLLPSVDGKKELDDETMRQASLWEAHCTAIMDVADEATVVESMLSFAFDVFACAVMPSADEEDGHGSVLVTELPFLMQFCVAQLQLVPNPQLGRIFAMVLLLVEKDDISMLRRRHVLDIFRPAFHPPKPPQGGFFRRLIDRLSQPSSAATIQTNATAGIMARARQEAVLCCLGFDKNLEDSDSIRRYQAITHRAEINSLGSRFFRMTQPSPSLNVHVNSAIGRVERKVTSAQLADELASGIAYTTKL